MIIQVSISQFRQNIAEYIEKVKAGYTIILKDEKKDRQVAQLTGKKAFDPETFGNVLKAASGVLTDKNHPEWQTKYDVVAWLVNERKNSDRSF